MALQQLRILSIHEETPDTKSLVLEEIGEKIHYLPGQFLTLLLPSNKEVRRSYSLSSHTALDSHLQIAVKRIANGQYSRWLYDDAKPGDIIETIGASGFFTLPSALPEEAVILLLAAGSGITPMMALLKELLYMRCQRVVLVYSNRSAAQTIFLKEIQQLEQDFADRLKMEYLFSTSKNLLRARLSKALLAQLLHQHVPHVSQAIAYLCGPHDYMQMAGITLLAEGVTVDNIRTEIFYTGQPKAANRPPDENPHLVTVLYKQNVYQLTVKYPNTILQTAKLAGIDLPYSCEAGRCGTCAATCTKGEVWMSRNEVLLDKEVAGGRVLTCTGYPIHGDAEVNFIFEE